jgi:hypothetical protein
MDNTFYHGQLVEQGVWVRVRLGSVGARMLYLLNNFFGHNGFNPAQLPEGR